ncbi:hypothetical protein NY78_3010 [Desulfovibrio sp. TomC]|nr:hypothetical protein NY78_3010 [Desulfovibrio sp. TomC]
MPGRHNKTSQAAVWGVGAKRLPAIQSGPPEYSKPAWIVGKTDSRIWFDKALFRLSRIGTHGGSIFLRLWINGRDESVGAFGDLQSTPVNNLSDVLNRGFWPGEGTGDVRLGFVDGGCALEMRLGPLALGNFLFQFLVSGGKFLCPDSDFILQRLPAVLKLLLLLQTFQQQREQAHGVAQQLSLLGREGVELPFDQEAAIIVLQGVQTQDRWLVRGRGLDIGQRKRRPKRACSFCKDPDDQLPV